MLLGATWVYEGGCMAVRARDPIFRMEDLKGKKIGISKSLNTIKSDWWRIQEHMGIENMLMLHGMTMDDIELVEFPYPDDWYDKPEMLQVPMNNPSELWMRRDHKHDLAFRPLETALLDGKVDAIYTQSKVFQHLQEATGRIKMVEDLSRYPDWTIQIANTPAVITCTDVMADEHPELVIAYMKAMIKVGRWANENKHAAGAILNRQTFYLDAEDTYQGIKDVDMVPSLSAQNMQCVKIGKDFMVSHGYIENDFDVDEWARPEFLEQAATEVLKEEWERRSWSKLPTGGGLEVEGCGSGNEERPSRWPGDARARPAPSEARRRRKSMNSSHDEDGRRAGAEARAEVENITPKDAYDEISTGQAVALDVREPVEWEHHIEGAVQVPRGLLEFAADPPARVTTPSSIRRRVIVYCRRAHARPRREHPEDAGVRERRQP